MSPLGSGSFGAVYKALYYDTGRFTAVKRLVIKNHQEFVYARKREVDTLARIRHPPIVDFIHSQVWSIEDVLIFAGLKDGSLGSLLRNEKRMGIAAQEVPNIARLVLHHMLQALGFLACYEVVHHVVKPDNILSLLPKTRDDVPYQFQIGDFGICNPHNNADSIVGTPIFAAPERRSGSQTPRFDIGSLMVTILWTLNVDNFATELESIKEESQVLPLVMRVASTTGSSPIGTMAKVDPSERASAAQLLAKWFDGKGLTTPIEDIAPLEVLCLHKGHRQAEHRYLDQHVSYIYRGTPLLSTTQEPRR
ncbi:MAG: hypothetical protein Q9205_004993 [Flavoplaca limonia]